MTRHAFRPATQLARNYETGSSDGCTDVLQYSGAHAGTNSAIKNICAGQVMADMRLSGRMETPPSRAGLQVTSLRIQDSIYN